MAARGRPLCTYVTRFYRYLCRRANQRSERKKKREKFTPRGAMYLSAEMTPQVSHGRSLPLITMVPRETLPAAQTAAVVTNATNERDYRSNSTIGGANGGFSVVYGRRVARGILESSLNYGASHIESNIGSWVGAVSRIPMGKVKSVYPRERGPDNNSRGASYVSEAAMCNTAKNCSRICSPSEFYPNVKGNLTKIIWAHAVNSQAELDKALSSGRSIGCTAQSTKSDPELLLSFFVYCTRELRDTGERCPGYSRVLKYCRYCRGCRYRLEDIWRGFGWTLLRLFLGRNGLEPIFLFENANIVKVSASKLISNQAVL